MSPAAQADTSMRWVGLDPVLPWPLSACRWWTQPVAAERLAALRIGLASLLLADILCTYLPNFDMFFADGAGSGPQVFGWYTQAPRWTWSLLRGLGDPLVGALLLLVWLALALGIVLEWFTRSSATRPASSATWRVTWLLLGIGLVGSSWDRAWNEPTTGKLFWVAPAMLAAAALIALLAESILFLLGRVSRSGLWLAVAAFVTFVVLLAMGVVLDTQAVDVRWLRRLLQPWQNDATLLYTAAILWAIAAGMLALGWQTRIAAIATFALNASFVNLNPNIDNAGDVIRCIIVFYLMLCPCGAVWSVDRLIEKYRSRVALSHARIVVSPWPLRLLFVQLTLIYFMNGLYKLGGANWWSGDSLYYVLCDVTLTRFSYAQFPVPFWLTRIMTWLVLVWEVGFPLWVSLRWTRTAALWIGVLFHVGIYVSLELGNFAPYILTLYLPLVPWERMTREK